jgi:macrolide-specific efflux system membrane fusion protein
VAVSARRKRRRGLIAGALAVVVVAGGTAAYLVTRGSDKSEADQPQLQTATAQRTELRETVDAQFTISRSQSFSLKAPAPGTVTGVHMAAGKALPSLKPLVDIDGTAIYGIPSATPFYRGLADGDSGDDVKALQAALAAAGYDPGSVDGDFGGATVSALDSWQVANGLDETGRLALSGFVSFPPGSTVLDLPIAVGDRLGAGGALATVGGSNALVADADVSQLDVVRLKPGLRAELIFDALPNDQMDAKVSTIALDAESQSASAGSSAPVEYSVELRPTRLPATVRAGMTGQASVVIVDLRNAIVVPAAAVGGGAGQPTVQVLEGGQTRSVPVVVGLATANGVQILAGLQAGQTVVTGVVGSDSANATQTGQGQGGGPFGGGVFFGGGGRGLGGGGGGRGGAGGSGAGGSGAGGSGAAGGGARGATGQGQSQGGP